MRVLLLGGTGAMGVSLRAILAGQGHEVYVTSRGTHIDGEHIHYLRGDAHDGRFIDDILKSRYDVVVDFMLYGSDEFRHRAEKILRSTGQYLFLSSSRVYADSREPITEESPRLLDVCTDEEYLRTDEYALAKAREENVLFEGRQKNWIIVRPYITYNVERLQLGGYEKDVWLRRALEGRAIPLPKDVAACQTTLTCGTDVASAIVSLLGNDKAAGQIFNLTGTEHMTWSGVLDIYSNVIEKRMGTRPKIYSPENSKEIYEKSRQQVSDNL